MSATTDNDGASEFAYSTAKLSFDGLDPTDFEELCFELFQELGYVNVDSEGHAESVQPI